MVPLHLHRYQEKTELGPTVRELKKHMQELTNKTAYSAGSFEMVDHLCHQQDLGLAQLASHFAC